MIPVYHKGIYEVIKILEDTVEQPVEYNADPIKYEKKITESMTSGIRKALRLLKQNNNI